MTTWMRKLGLGAVGLCLIVAAAGCDNGGGGSGLLRVFFGINGSGDCDRVIVEVDLSSAQAEVARTAANLPNCLINSSLLADGCEIDFDEDGGILTVTISDCTIPAVTNLFSCVFEEGDVDDIQANTVAICSCDELGCDENPPVCVSRNSDPGSCEDCDNGRDDDGNGLTDCADPNCANDRDCNGLPPTTSTTIMDGIGGSTTTLGDDGPTTTMSSTTTSTTTTTTMATPLEWECDIVFSLDDPGKISALQFEVDYQDIPGSFLDKAGNPSTLSHCDGNVKTPACSVGLDCPQNQPPNDPDTVLCELDSAVECASLLPQSAGAIAAFNDIDAEDTLIAAFILVPPGSIEGPIDVAQCTFASPFQCTSQDFANTVENVQATDTDGNPVIISPDVSASVSATRGPPGGPTTTTTTTTTIAVATTTTTTTTVDDPGPGKVVVYTLDDAVSIGALQFVTDYGSAPGAFQTKPDPSDNNPDDGIDMIVDCMASVPGIIAVFNDLVDTRMLNFGIISLFGFNGPTELARCPFIPTGGVTAGSFPTLVENAAGPDLVDITPTPGITVTVEDAQ